ncbi:MAG: hypothetical protein JXA01_09170 [Dehalococcoidia bacterium]|nr:hypothetical protein [Dehalococcoidia bacterium]
MRIRYIWILTILFILIFTTIDACALPAKPVSPAEFVVNEIKITPQEVTPFENTTITAEIANVGEIADNYTAILNIDGKEIDKQVITIGPSENKTICFSINEPGIGNHMVTIGPVTKNFKTYELEEYTLKHDTDSWDTYFAFWDPGGLWTKFDPPAKPFQIDKICIKGFRSQNGGENDKVYTIKIWDKDFKKELFSKDYPYTNFPTSMGIVKHEINPPIIVQNEFVIEFISHSEATGPGSHQAQNGVFLGVDSSSDGSKYIGISYLGKNSKSLMDASIRYMQTLAHAAWTIQVDGVGQKKEALVSPQVVTKPSLQGIPITLRYDNIGTDINYTNQIAIWHSYMTVSFIGPIGISGTQIKTPLIILPYKEGSVCLYKDLSEQYKYLNINTTSYRGTVDDKVELNKGGWGLATTFHPEKVPYSIQNIKIAGVANYTLGTLDDYDKKYITIRILNKAEEVIWSKDFKWSDFRNRDLGPDRRPEAFWSEVAVDNVVVNDDFTVDVLALSKGYDTYGESYDYFAVAYEKISNCGPAATNSFISENGKRTDPGIGLYDQFGNRICFNLCIRVDGVY